MSPQIIYFYDFSSQFASKFNIFKALSSTLEHSPLKQNLSFQQNLNYFLNNHLLAHYHNFAICTQWNESNFKAIFTYSIMMSGICNLL